MPKKKAINDVNEYKNYKNLILLNTPLIEVPKKMLYINSKGKKTDINTLTKKGRIATRDKKPAIKFINNDSNHFNIKNNVHQIIKK